MTELAIDRARIGRVACVALDDASCGRLAADHLINLGHRILLGFGRLDLPLDRSRLAAFATRASERGLTAILRNPRSELARYPVPHPEIPMLREHLASGPAALFAPQDRSADWYRHSCAAHGIRIPEELAVLGVGDEIQICEARQPAIASIAPPFHAMGVQAAVLTHRLLRGDMPAHSVIRLNASHVESRASCAVPQTLDPLVRRALALIGRQLSDPIAVADLARRLRVSERHLHRRFRTAMDIPIMEHVIEQRILRAKQLLASTAAPIAQLARQCGFPAPEHFSSTFRHHVGETPSTYRCRFAPSDSAKTP